jgi:peptide/nickel transport system substrate-binding protein
MKQFFSKSRILKISATALTIAALASCSGKKTEAASGPKEKIVTIGITNDPTSLSPFLQNNTASQQLSKLTLLPLVNEGFDSDGTAVFVNRLAESVTTTDNVHFTIKINQKIKWSDGKPVTADDVVFTFHRITDPRAGNFDPSFFSRIAGTDDAGLTPNGTLEGVRKVDEYTVEVTTKNAVPVTSFNQGIGTRLRTLPKHILGDVPPEELKGHPFYTDAKLSISNGPFLFREYVPAQYATFVKNPDYFLGAPKIDVLNFKILSGTQITAQLEAGEIDMNYPFIGNIPSDDWERVRTFPHINTTSAVSSSFNILFYNTKILNNQKLRQALDLTIDREIILKQFLKDSAYIAKTTLTDVVPGWNSEAAKWEYNPEKAKQLLEESGWDVSKKIRFYIPTGNSTRERIMEVIAAGFKSIGLNIVEEKMDFPTSLARIQQRENYDIGIIGVPEYTLVPALSIRMVLGPIGWTNYNTPRLEELFRIAQTSVDERAINEALREIQAIEAEAVPASGIYAERPLFAKNKRVLHGDLNSVSDFLDAEKWDVEP